MSERFTLSVSGPISNSTTPEGLIVLVNSKPAEVKPAEMESVEVASADYNPDLLKVTRKLLR